MLAQNLITLRELTSQEILNLFRDAAEFKKARAQGKSRPKPLAGKIVGLLFEKPSVRTRVSFEVGAALLGGQTLYFGPVELQQGKRESAKDVARVLSRYLDAMVVRTFKHEDVEETARYSSVPVINGLSDDSHPCQALADLFTVQEKWGRLKTIRIAYIGDGNNVCHSLMEGCALLGAHLTVATPRGFSPRPEVQRWAKDQARRTGSRLILTGNPRTAARGAQVIYTDVWTSMGQETQMERRRKQFAAFQINRSLMRLADPKAIFLHCLPAHRGQEVTDEVMDSAQSVIYDQAENRLYVQMALLMKLLTRPKRRA